MNTLLITIFSILLCGLFAGMEIGCFTVNKIRLQYRVLGKVKNAKILLSNLKDPQIFVFTMLIFQNIATYISSLIVTNYYIKTNIAGEELRFIYNFIPWSAEIAATLTLLLPIFIFAEISPKNLFRLKADLLMYKTARLQKFCIAACKPLTVTLKYFAGLLANRSSEVNQSYELKSLSTARLKIFFSESSNDGVISKHQNNMISNTLEIHKISITKVMIPLIKLTTLSINDPIENYHKILKANSFNYIPVYAGSKDNILGRVDLFDVWNSLNAKKVKMDNFKDIISIESGKNILQTIYELQGKKETLAIVKNKKGKTIGIIFLQDIIKLITESI